MNRFTYRYVRFLCLFAAISFSSLNSATPKVLPVPTGQPLRAIVEAHYTEGNVYIGGTTSWNKPSRTTGLLDREFSYITPENEFKQFMIHPKPGTWNWRLADAWVEHAAANDQALRMHCPIGPQVSTWAKEDDRTPAELATNLAEYLIEVCKRYDGHPNVKWMDVVNETVHPRKGDWFGPREGTKHWENPCTIIGFDETHPLRPPLYIQMAFKIANKYAPNTKLIINQHGSMEPAAWEKVKALVPYLREQGLRVDGLGWQAHVDVGWETEEGNVQRFAELIDWAHANDLSFHVTENNVWLRKQKDYEAQAETFATILRVLLSKRHTGVVTWNVWNLSDDDSWVKNRHLDGCIFDYDYAPKPAYYALQNVLLEMSEK